MMAHNIPAKGVWQVNGQRYTNPNLLLPSVIDQLYTVAELFGLAQPHTNDVPLSPAACHGVTCLLGSLLETLEAIRTTVEAVDAVYFQAPDAPAAAGD